MTDTVLAVLNQPSRAAAPHDPEADAFTWAKPLEEGESVVAAIPVSSSGVIVCGEGRGAKPREEAITGSKLLEYTLHRTRKGRAVSPRFVRVTGLKPAVGARARAPELPPEDEEGNVQLL